MADTVDTTIIPGIDPQSDLNFRARELICQVVADYDKRYGCGSMSCAIYDTAWVSLVTKQINGSKHWLFPECFHFLLQNQSSDGSWGTSRHSQIDGILNTASALLSLQKHAVETLQMRDLDPTDLHARKLLAAQSLTRQLKAWNVELTKHVGFEVIVPSLLDLLERQDTSLHFSFDGRETLMLVNAAKMSRFRPEALYQFKTTAIHSLEAFIGKIDFDKVKHHLIHGSMMGSPSSTAAYLMNASTWDGEAELYLRHVIDRAAGQGNGGVPSAYPSLYFEMTWVLSTLLGAGFSTVELQSDGLTTVQDILREGFQNGNGLIGFAPGFEADVDDTAKGIFSLNMMGACMSTESMVQSFEADDHFRTYPGERDPSFSANCNALLALLHQPEVSHYATQILKATCFLCKYWWESGAGIKDKWNTCHLYPCLLLVDAFTDLLTAIDMGVLGADFLDSNMHSRVAITIFQACARSLLEQHDSGAWMESIEQTAYGVLILCKARKMTIFNDLCLELDEAIRRGIKFLTLAATTPLSSERIWIEKVSYASPRLTEAYVIAAQRAADSPAGVPSIRVASNTDMQSEPTSLVRYVQLFRQTPLFSWLPEWQVRLSAMEASLFIPLLRACRLEIFPRKDMEEDKYFEIIPFTWTSCNNRSRTFVSTSFLYDMMVISFLNYQVDEFMESVAGPAFRDHLEDLCQLIDDLFIAKDIENSADINGHNGYEDSDSGADFSVDEKPYLDDKTESKAMTGPIVTQSQYEDVRIPLQRFVLHVLNHPSIAKASSWDFSMLKIALRTFLLAHTSQTEDNDRFGLDQDNTANAEFTSASTSFFQWVRTTSADHTSCPYSFAFVSALISASEAGGADCFPSTCEKYFAEAVCRHLATMCRMYNDYGSVARDCIERNLNSINFPEFNRGTNVDIHSDQSKKEALFTLAEYERCCLNKALDSLGGASQIIDEPRAEYTNPNNAVINSSMELRTRKMAIFRMFCNVTDLYGQIYVVRDIASHMKT